MSSSASKLTFKDIPSEEYFTPGHVACPGCGANIAVRLALKALGPNTIAIIPPNCLGASALRMSSFTIAASSVPFAATGAAISGVVAAYRIKGKPRANVLAIAGDGGTADIGLQSLSAAIERGDDFLYMCYDNEAYMNTGSQRSGSTPQGAWTANTPTGKTQGAKDLPAIMAAHPLAYMATASIGYPLDLFAKFQQAQPIVGPKYIHVHAPCPVGWQFKDDATVEVARLAVDSGIFPLYEIVDGRFRLTHVPGELVSVEAYRKVQGRFGAAAEDPRLQQKVDRQWNDMLARHASGEGM